MDNIFLKVADFYKDSRGSAMCIVTSNSGSVPGKIGAKMVVFEDGSIEGTVGGGAVESKTIEEALEAIRTQKPVHKEYDLGKDFAMNCGGNVSIYIEPFSKPAKLYIFGAGHIGKALAQYAPDLGFETVVIDWRNDIFENPEDIKYKQLCKPYLEAVDDIPFDTSTYIVIVTPNHEMDEDILAAVGAKTAAYIGLIGSKRKIATLNERFRRDSILTDEELEKIDMPIGIKFNAIAPKEIAISILAKIIHVKNS
ncbi:MAG: XdhC family protein [Bacteroidales bacterium]|nr:XdhC family protein [Tenuifilaceae bacterium]